MKNTTHIIIIVLVSASVFTWSVSIWQYDTMMSSMMTFYYSPAALSLFTIVWTAGMAAMMFPAIVPMVLFYNRLIDSSNKNSKGGIHSQETSRMLYPGQDKTHDDDRNDNTKDGGISVPSSVKQDHIFDLFRSKTYNMMIFVLSYLAIWAITGIVLLVGWSFFLDMLLVQLGLNDSQQQQQLLSTNSIYGIVLIVAGVYQFSSLKTKCLGYCESPLSFFMRRWQKGKIGALKMGMYHGLYCLGCCWPYFLLMVALGWMNIFWMGLFAAIIFTEKMWAKGGLWIARITGICLMIIGILSLMGMITFPSDLMNSNISDSNMMSMDKSMNMNMSSSSSSTPDNMMLHN
jgi:predicted metal-binding membrane protein